MQVAHREQLDRSRCRHHAMYASCAWAFTGHSDSLRTLKGVQKDWCPALHAASSLVLLALTWLRYLCLRIPCTWCCSLVNSEAGACIGCWRACASLCLTCL